MHRNKNKVRVSIVLNVVEVLIVVAADETVVCRRTVLFDRWARIRTYKYITLSSLEKIFADCSFVAGILAEGDRVLREHRATVVYRIAEEQTVGDVDVFLAHSQYLALDHW